MKYLELTLPTPAENLACDEAILEASEAGRVGEVLRVWESPGHVVVLGYANQAEREANLAVCRAKGIPVLRRCSGGGAVLQGPGSLSFSLCLQITESGPLAGITGTNRWIMEQHRQLFERLLGRPVAVQGHTDLAVGNRKFSGNSQRRQRRFLLFHGSFLLGLDLTLIQKLLPSPSKEPDYRAKRSHLDLLTNLPLSAATVVAALRDLWHAEEASGPPPNTILNRLLVEKYRRDEWNFRF